MASLAESSSARSSLLGAAEDVLLCVDASAEMGEPFGDAGSSTRLHMVKKSLAALVRHKLRLDPRHRVGLAVLANDASLALDFTSDLDLVLAVLDSLVEQPASPSFDFRHLFEGFETWFGGRLAGGDLSASDASGLPTGHAPTKGPPGNSHRLVRAILVYGRSRALPTLPAAKPPLFDHPRFFLDVLYVHRKVAKGNPEQLVCQATYDLFIDTFESDDADCAHKTEYMVEVSGSASRLQQHMAMLLAHPAHRDEQDDFIEKLDSAA